jgi:hypothetical protein
MARVPIPQQGQPLDLAYIATLANAVNQLSEEGAALAQGNNFIMRGRLSDTPNSYKLYGAQIIAQEIIFVAGTGDTLEQTVSFSPNNFASPPIVSATLINPSDTEANVSIKNITSGSATVLVKFPGSENNSTSVSILAIGIPSSVS